MGLSPYANPTDAGVLCIILVNTANYIFIFKEMVRSILNVMGIRIASWDEYSRESLSDSCELPRSPSDSYVEEFRNRTPAVRFDTVCCNHQPEHECSVCLTKFEPNAEINHLSCGHVFHKDCLEKWLKYWHVTCPNCRNCMMPLEEEEDACPM